VVLDAVTRTLGEKAANVHRSVHQFGDEATEAYESARRSVARHVGADQHEIVFTRNATDALGLVARCWPRTGRVVVSWGEHHSALLPWGDTNVVRLPPRADGGVDETAVRAELSRGGVGVVVLGHESNVTGSRADVRGLADATHAAGAILVLDAAQSVPHAPVDVTALGCDFLAFSGHKCYGPTGLGVLYGRADHLDELRPDVRGGGTVERVLPSGVEDKDVPWRLEPGTPAVEAAVGLVEALQYMRGIGLDEIDRHVRDLSAYARAQLADLPGIRIVSAPGSAITSFVATSPSHLLARGLSDRFGVCVRSGYHCAQPLHDELGLSPTIRLSFGVYNRPVDVDRCVVGLKKLLSVI
jgi:cysteine desulfurase/selenocysteine lyase